jgi:arginyl-tRNA synthetase
MRYWNEISLAVTDALQALYGIEESPEAIKLGTTPPEFEGECTFVVFPYLRQSKKPPHVTADELGARLVSDSVHISAYNVVKGFLNLSLSDDFLSSLLQRVAEEKAWDNMPSTGKKIVLEYCGPNTNKPLHLGHIRNMLLGMSTVRLLQAAGNEVHPVNIYNDRGIAICKSMVAYLRSGEGKTPESTDTKGDHFVGDFYVEYARLFEQEVTQLVAGGMDKEQAEKQAPIYKEAVDMLQRWEAGDETTLALWNKMNGWVYGGFNETFDRLGVHFEKDYHESVYFSKGRDLVLEGLDKGIFFKKDDGSVWVDLTEEGLDQKVLLRSDGTSVYITQDIGVAHARYEDYGMDTSAYVVANEQDYHFKVLKLVLEKLGEPYAEGIFHLSYGMVDLPEGKMKSREGTVVDADDLMDEMEQSSKAFLEQSDKQQDFSEEEKAELYRKIGMAALKYFILRVDPKKRILFNPKESIDLQGNTGPFIQYTYARIQSVLRKVEGLNGEKVETVASPDKDEKALILTLSQYPDVLQEAASACSPAEIANYTYNLARQFNQFYADHSILRAETPAQQQLRTLLAHTTADVLKHGLWVLGIEAVERM